MLELNPTFVSRRGILSVSIWRTGDAKKREHLLGRFVR